MARPPRKRHRQTPRQARGTDTTRRTALSRHESISLRFAILKEQEPHLEEAEIVERLAREFRVNVKTVRNAIRNPSVPQAHSPMVARLQDATPDQVRTALLIADELERIRLQIAKLKVRDLELTFEELARLGIPPKFR